MNIPRETRAARLARMSTTAVATTVAAGADNLAVHAQTDSDLAYALRRIRVAADIMGVRLTINVLSERAATVEVTS